MIKTEFMKLYEELSELLEDQNLQEAGPYTQTLIRAYKKDLNSLCDKESLRAGIN